MSSLVYIGELFVQWSGTVITAPGENRVSIIVRNGEQSPLCAPIDIEVFEQTWRPVRMPGWDLQGDEEKQRIHLTIVAEGSQDAVSVPDTDVQVGDMRGKPLLLRYRAQRIGERWVLDLMVIGGDPW